MNELRYDFTNSILLLHKTTLTFLAFCPHLQLPGIGHQHGTHWPHHAPSSRTRLAGGEASARRTAQGSPPSPHPNQPGLRRTRSQLLPRARLADRAGHACDGGARLALLSSGSQSEIVTFASSASKAASRKKKKRLRVTENIVTVKLSVQHHCF